jgi:DMATS type aromatic prenyltransferase
LEFAMAMTHFPSFSQDVSMETFEQYGTRQLTSLAHATGLGDETSHMVEVFKRMVSPWGSWRIGHTPRWFSDVCADGSPIEFSMAVDGGEPEVRVLVEALAEDNTLPALQQASRDLTRMLAREYGADVERLRDIEDLFLPEKPQGECAMMHAVSFRRDEAPDFKVYVNPDAQGEANAPLLVYEALRRLGFEGAWSSIREFAQRGFTQDRLVYLSLDLAAHEHARLKVYFRHYGAAPAEVDAAMAIARGHKTGHAESFCQDVVGHSGRFMSQPLVSCLSFTDPREARPSSATLYVPLWTYAANDAITSQRVRSCLLSRGLPVAPYEAALKTLARRPLEQGNGIHTYTAYRFQNGKPRFTSYWSSELYGRNPAPRYQRPSVGEASEHAMC